MNSPWLFIDTHAPDAFRFGRFVPGETLCVKHVRGRAERLLPRLAQNWPRMKQEIGGICVVAGPGSFSAVRTGVLAANLLARLLDVPLVGVTVSEAASLDDLGRLIKQKKLKRTQYVTPLYSAEPNITLAKVCS